MIEPIWNFLGLIGVALIELIGISITANMNNKTKKQKEIVEEICNCGIKEIEVVFEKFQNATKIYESNEYVVDKYCISIDSKRRYIIPLVKYECKISRIKDISDKAKKDIEEYLNFKTEKYAYFDFNF